MIAHRLKKKNDHPQTKKKRGKSHLENKIDLPFEFEVLIFFESSIFFNLNMWVLVKGNGKKVDIWIGDSFFFNRKILCPQYFYNTFTTNIYIYIYQAKG